MPAAGTHAVAALASPRASTLQTHAVKSRRAQPQRGSLSLLAARGRAMATSQGVLGSPTRPGATPESRALTSHDALSHQRPRDTPARSSTAGARSTARRMRAAAAPSATPAGTHTRAVRHFTEHLRRACTATLRSGAHTEARQQRVRFNQKKKTLSPFRVSIRLLVS
jgi:hypothetical protein